MNAKFLGFVVVVVIVLGAALGALLGSKSAFEAPPVVAAIAEQERAKVALVEAQADKARAEADQAAYAAEVTRRNIADSAQAGRLAAYAVAAAVSTLALGAAVGLVAWGWSQSRLIYPSKSGQWPIVTRALAGGGLALVDTSRLLGPVVAIYPNGDIEHQNVSEAAALQLATQSQAAVIMAGIAGRAEADDVVGRISKGTGGLPAPTFAAAAGDGVKLVYVKTPGAANTEAGRDLQDLAELIRAAKTRGLARRAWVGLTFASGHVCSRPRYDDLVRKLEKAGVICHEGQSWRLSVGEAEALDAFGVGSKDSDEGRASDDDEGDE